MIYSVVIPVYNEEKTVRPLYFRIKETMDKLAKPYELIFVNDASYDKSFFELNQISVNPANLVIINLARHLGQSAALQAGFNIAKGEIIITLDADLQVDPIDIPKLLEKIEGGYDLVCGYRYKRKDPKIKIYTSRLAVFFRRLITREEIHDPGCPLKAFKKSVLEDILLDKDMHRFFTLLVKKAGYKITEVKILHYPRKFGKSHYNTCNRLFNSLCIFLRILLDKRTYSVKNNQTFIDYSVIRI